MESVVVNLKCLMQVHKDDHLVAARCVELGLTAYSYEREEAVANFKQLFNRCIRAYRDRGILEEVLGRSGLEWWYASEYPSDRPPYEDTNPVDVVAIEPDRKLFTAEEETAITEALTILSAAWPSRQEDASERAYAA